MSKLVKKNGLMDVRQAALKAIIKILEKNNQFDEIINFYSAKVSSASGLYSLISGAVKHKLTLDFFIQKISTRKLKDMSYQVKNSLRLAIYELVFLNTPDYAALNSYVNLVKTYDKKSGGFINGVLRNFIRKRDQIKLPDININPAYGISITHSHPEWMVKRWIDNWGIKDTISICEYNNKIPKLVIRINTLKISIEAFIDFLKEKEISFCCDEIIKDCLIIDHKGPITEIAGFNEGYWIVQGESSSLVSIVFDPKEGEKILDICAAPGGKTAHIAALTNNKSEIIAIDINSSRLERIKENCSRLGIKSVTTQVADAAIYSSNSQFDRILIDAPCSNTGVLIKRVDARWRRSPEDIKNLSDIQLRILNNSAKLLKPGGIMVYSTCSIEKEENQEVIEKFLESNKNFVPDKIAPYLPWHIDQDKGYFQILQSRQDIDGFFIARLKKAAFCNP